MDHFEKAFKGLSKEDIKKAKQTGGESLMKNLDKGTLKALNEILSDKEKTRQILSSPEAKKLFELFKSNKGD